jgi:DNA (cytosine-5)-methyltransferase 1
MNHGSLFSGIGGFDLAAEWIRWNNTFHCEWMPFPRKVLNHYWPNSISYEDITKTDFTIHRGTIDILTGGFPCQPYSSAGKRLGKEDERHLWPHMLRAISEINPTYVVGENVRGLTNWNGGMVFEEVCADLESQGYKVQPILLPACAVGAPHRRDRIWFIAYSNSRRTQSEQDLRQTISSKKWIDSNDSQWNASNSDGLRQYKRECNNEEQPSEGGINALNDINENDGQGAFADTECFRLEHSAESRQVSSEKANSNGERCKSSLFITPNDNGYKSNWNNFPTQSPICSRNDGLSPKLDGITFPKWRAESIKGYGNAIVPQVAYEIFKVIAEMDRLEKLQLKLF